jgi:hypothetical protein
MNAEEYAEQDREREQALAVQRVKDHQSREDRQRQQARESNEREAVALNAVLKAIDESQAAFDRARVACGDDADGQRFLARALGAGDRVHPPTCHHALEAFKVMKVELTEMLENVEWEGEKLKDRQEEQIAKERKTKKKSV